MSLPWGDAFIDPSDLLGCRTTDASTCEELNGTACLSPPWGEDGARADWFWGLLEVLTLMALYGVILFKASNMLSEGSELLLLVPSLAGLVGSVVLPILGAVPDGAIMLFSGLGPREVAQQQLTVGVGALAGSTIMLLTIPWGGAILAGRVKIGSDGTARYKVRTGRPLPSRQSSSGVASPERSARQLVVAAKLGQATGWRAFLFGTGVTPDATIRKNALLMLGTALVYLVIQGPATRYAMQREPDDVAVAQVEKGWALAGLLLAVLTFGGYLWLMMRQAASSEVKQHAIDKAIVKQIQARRTAPPPIPPPPLAAAPPLLPPPRPQAAGPISLSGVMAPLVEAGRARHKSGPHPTERHEPLSPGSLQEQARGLPPTPPRSPPDLCA
jgi:Ca2+/Na+ antiporter